MRKSLFVLIIILLFTLSACDTKESLSSDSDTTTGTLIMEPNEDETTSESEKETKETERTAQTEETSVSETTRTETAETSSASKPVTELPPIVSEEKKDTTQQNTSSAAVESTTPTETTTSSPTENTVTESESTEVTEPIVPTEPNATASDASVIADLVVQYLNDYRTAQGTSAATRLPGLTEYAKYRSRQLISDFSHNTYDERAAATALSYGMYVDPALYGISGEPYYTACSGEAIAKAGYVGTIDYVAKSMADLIRNSSAHWSYIGSGEYQYIGVGITYDSGMWYCDVALTRENYG